MSLTEVKTEKVYGRISNVHIGYDSTHGVNIKQGILSFEYWRNSDNLRLEIPGSPTRNIVQQLGMSFFSWKLRFLSDCRIAFFGTDVQVVAGNQYAMIDNNLSNKIEYFKVIMKIQDGSSLEKTRIYTIKGGFALRNRAYIGDDNDAEYEYEGDAEYITYSDA
jgi:hypothetical protein